MAKIFASIAMFALAFAVGVAASTQVQTTRNTETGDTRSCQVKLIQTHGHVVWMSCEEWKKANGL